MTSIFTTKDNLEAICLDEQKQTWLNMIIKLQEVYINDTVDENADPDNDALLIPYQATLRLYYNIPMEYFSSTYLSMMQMTYKKNLEYYVNQLQIWITLR